MSSSHRRNFYLFGANWRRPDALEADLLHGVGGACGHHGATMMAVDPGQRSRPHSRGIDRPGRVREDSTLCPPYRGRTTGYLRVLSGRNSRCRHRQKLLPQRRDRRDAPTTVTIPVIAFAERQSGDHPMALL